MRRPNWLLRRSYRRDAETAAAAEAAERAAARQRILELAWWDWPPRSRYRCSWRAGVAARPPPPSLYRGATRHAASYRAHGPVHRRTHPNPP